MARSIELDFSHRGGDVLATALGASVLMWAVAYVGLSPAVNAPPLLMAGFALACLFASGVYLARATDRGVTGGVKLGLLLGFINFLIVASFHGREAPGEALRFGAKWIVAFTLIAVALSAIGSFVGARTRSTQRREIDWTSRLAVIVAVALFPLLISGGIVTGLDAGLAVPDWLTTFGYPMMFYPLIAMQENPGVYAEHFHRLWGMLVGLSVILLAIQIHRVDQRMWLRWMSIAIIIAVIIQGVLGAAWVLRGGDTNSTQQVADAAALLDPEQQEARRKLMRYFAIGHGVFGQIVFAVVVAMAAFVSRTWILRGADSRVRVSLGDEEGVNRGLPPRGYSSASSSPIDVQAAIALFVLLVIQLAFGATYRHFRREAFDATAGIHALWAHIILATILIGVIIFVAGRAWGVHRDKPVLPRLGKSLLHLLMLQIALGVGALIVALKRGDSPTPFAWEITITTAHQAVGALMLATSGLIAVWSWRLLREPARAKPQAADC